MPLDHSKNLRIALQKSGRLAEGSRELLQKCGIKMEPNKQQLFSQDEIFGIDFIYARDDDIPGLIQNGICDLGIFGRNLLEESFGPDQEAAQGLRVIMPLNFSKCRLSLAVPKQSDFATSSDLQGKVVATSYPNILKKYLAQEGIQCQVATMHGSVELAPKIGIADLICDLISSGTTLKENGLKELVKILDSEALLVAGSRGAMNADKEEQLKRLQLRICGVLNASQRKYIMMHIERDRLSLLSSILPGCESPTILELKDLPNMVAVHVVSPEQVFWETIENLKKIGASSILVLPIEKMVD
jgi:ATP phosphoribosyltransferase